MLFLPSRILVNYKFPFPSLRFLAQNHLALLKDRFLKKVRKISVIKRIKCIVYCVIKATVGFRKG